jgi:hypothetical protein
MGKGETKMKIWIFLCLAGALLIIPGCGKSNPAAEEAALKAAQEWLGIVDNGQHAESWQQASEYFRNAISQKDWEQAMKSVRAPFGAVKSRVVKSKKYRTTIPGAPDGQYVIIQFKTSFENKASAVETITPMLEKDGSWRVSGYYIK